MKEAHDHSRVSPEGQALGEQMARMYDLAEKRLGARHAEPGERCRTCAFRAGTVPNGCAQTQLDISKCVADGIPFYCHQRRGELCHGWVMARMGLRDLLQPLAGTEHDYPLSPPDSQRHIVDAAEAKRERRAEKRRQLALTPTKPRRRAGGFANLEALLMEKRIEMNQIEDTGAPAPTSYGLPARIDGMDAAQLRATLTEDSTREAMGRLAALDTLSAMLWLYRRLPRALGRQAHIDAVVEQLARQTGADVASDLAERGPAPANEHEQEK